MSFEDYEDYLRITHALQIILRSPVTADMPHTAGFVLTMSLCRYFSVSHVNILGSICHGRLLRRTCRAHQVLKMRRQRPRQKMQRLPLHLLSLLRASGGEHSMSATRSLQQATVTDLVLASEFRFYRSRALLCIPIGRNS